VPIDQYGSTRTVVAQRALERRATTIGTAIGVVGIRLEIDEPKWMTDGSSGPGHSLRLPGANAPLTGTRGCRGGAGAEPQAAGETDDEPAAEEMHQRLATSRRTNKKRRRKG
jgi:hypothetical protein